MKPRSLRELLHRGQHAVLGARRRSLSARREAIETIAPSGNVKGHRRRRRAKTLRLPAGQAPPPTDSAESVSIAWNAARYVSRTKRVAVTGTVSPYGVAIRVEGHAENVEEAVRDLFADPGTKSLMLAGDLLSGLVRMGRARRRRVKSAQMAWLKEVAAAAYLFI